MNSGVDVQHIVNGSAAAAGPGSEFRYQLGVGHLATLVVQGTGFIASFTLEGRITPAAPWVVLYGPDVSLAALVGAKQATIEGAMTEMRLTWSGNAGTLNAWLQA